MFVIADFDRFKFLSKEIPVNGWSLAKKEITTSSGNKIVQKTSPSKSELKKRL